MAAYAMQIFRLMETRKAFTTRHVDTYIIFSFLIFLILADSRHLFPPSNSEEKWPAEGEV